MPKQRVSGYHYVTLRNGRRKRVYSGKGGKRPATGRKPKGAPARRNSKYAYQDVIMGMGSYHTGRSRSSRGGGKLRMGNQAPRIANSNGRFIICHEEYLGDLNSSQAFVNFPFALNPGLTLAEGGFCNWLPNVAQQFEQWKARGIVFMYKSTSSDAVLSTAANSALGTVSMATEYNPLNPAFASKVQMENYEHSVSTKPSNNMRHYVECAKRQTPISEQFIRSGPVPTGGDIRLYDLGIFQIATSGQQSTGGAMGELWVSYCIEFLKPRIQSGIGGANEGNVNFDHIQILTATNGTAITPAVPFGTSTTVPLYPTSQSTLGGVATGGQATAVSFVPQPSPSLNNFLGGIPVLVGGTVVGQTTTGALPSGALGAAAANTYYFPPGVSGGNYLVVYNSKYGVGSANWTPVVTYVNCKILTLTSTDTLLGQANTSATTSTDAMLTMFVQVTSANAHFSFPGSVGAYSTPSFADLYVTQIPTPLEPQLTTPVVAAPVILMDHFSQLDIANMTPATPFGTTAVLQNPTSGSTLKGTVKPSTTTYNFPASISSGKFMWVYGAVYGGPSATVFEVNGFNNTAALDLCQTNSSFESIGQDASFEDVTSFGFLSVTGTPASINFQGVGGSTGPTDNDFYIFQMPSGIN